MTAQPQPLTTPQKVTLERFLVAALAAVRGTLIENAQAEIDEGARIPVKFAGRRAAWLSMPQPKTTAKVTGPEKLLAWVKEAWPSKVTDQVTIDLSNDDLVPFLAEHLPEALTHTPAPDPHLVSDLLKALVDRGCYATEAGEKVTEVPGVEVGRPAPVPRVVLEDDAGDVIGDAWRAGGITLDGLLTLPAGKEAA